LKLPKDQGLQNNAEKASTGCHVIELHHEPDRIGESKKINTTSEVLVLPFFDFANKSAKRSQKKFRCQRPAGDAKNLKPSYRSLTIPYKVSAYSDGDRIFLSFQQFLVPA
jgi:hypothetical protein